MGEAEVLQIKKGVFKITLHYWLSCGSWFVTNNVYSFRYQDQKFKLIGFDTTSFHRASGEITQQSINFLTGKIKQIHGGNEFESTTQPETIQWSKLKKTYSIQLDQMNFDDAQDFD